MLFIVGTKSYNLKNGQIENFNCPKCSKHTILDYSLYKRYTYITLIPLFPVDKVVYTSCSACDEIIEFNDLSEDLKLKIGSIKKDTIFKTPFWMYSGIIILIGFAIFGTYSFIKAKDNSKIYLNNLKQGDVCSVKVDDFYSTIRIDKVTKDSVFGTSNDFQAYLPYDTDEIDKPKNYTNSKVKYSKKDLFVLYDIDKIYSIKRERK